VRSLFEKKEIKNPVMADYRFSAQAISRGKGQSSVASAAYRSASRMVDERTGEIHDYTRKQGVTHSEVMTPEATPEWMEDRAQLWNAVEAVEKRKNSQLAREIQLSLPHELTDDQRRELVRDFVQEQFVDRGMIADVNIHHPDRQSDERNHHAHIMLTMRELTADGFHQKKATELARSWNDDELLKTWRAEWAHHQNQELERHGHEARVDHRSYEERGIDREATQHRGPVADDMEKNGKPSRIGEENREVEERNAQRAMERMELIRATAELAQEQAKLTAKQGEQARKLDADLENAYGNSRLTISTEIEAIDRRLEATGARKLFRDLFGRTKADMSNRQDLAQSLEQIQQREDLQRKELEREQRIEAQKLARAQNTVEEKMSRWSELEQARREDRAQSRPDAPSRWEALQQAKAEQVEKRSQEAVQRPEGQSSPEPNGANDNAPERPQEPPEPSPTMEP